MDETKATLLKLISKIEERRQAEELKKERTPEMLVSDYMDGAMDGTVYGLTLSLQFLYKELLRKEEG